MLGAWSFGCVATHIVGRRRYGLPSPQGRRFKNSPRAMKNVFAPVLAALLLLTFAGCGGRESSSGGGGHSHKAPHGGTLVEVGQHAYNVELVRDAAAGKLTAYILDGHAENFIRIAAPSFELIAITGGERKPLTLRAVANTATGETVGNTSQFEAQADWLKSVGEFPGMITSIDIRGTKFDNVALQMRK